VLYTALCIYSALSLSLVRMKVRDSDVLAWVRGQSKMSQVLGAFGLLDLTILRSFLTWCAFCWNLWTVYFSNFPIFFFGPRQTADNWNRRYWTSRYEGTIVLFRFLNSHFGAVITDPIRATCPARLTFHHFILPKEQASKFWFSWNSPSASGQLLFVPSGHWTVFVGRVAAMLLAPNNSLGLENSKNRH
jgi:hypothetical protein